MQEDEPQVINHAGDLVFPDIDFPLPIALIAMAALAWVLLAPTLIVVAARQGKVVRAAAAYSVGALIAALYFTGLSGFLWTGEGLAQRLGVWARNIWGPLLGLALIMSLLAVVIGRASSRFWPPGNQRGATDV